MHGGSPLRADHHPSGGRPCGGLVRLTHPTACPPHGGWAQGRPRQHTWKPRRRDFAVCYAEFMNELDEYEQNQRIERLETQVRVLEARLMELASALRGEDLTRSPAGGRNAGQWQGGDNTLGAMAKRLGELAGD